MFAKVYNLSVFMNAGGTAFVSAGQSIFVNRLIAVLPETAPGVDPSAVIATGATQIRTVYPDSLVPGIVNAYMIGLKDAFAITIGAAGASFVVALFSSRKRLKIDSLEREPML